MFVGVGPEGVGGELHGGAAVVEHVDEGVAVEAGEAFFLGSLALAVLGGLVGLEEGLEFRDFLRGAEAGKAVGGGAGDEGDGALDKGGAVGVDPGADEIAVEREVGGRIAVVGEHAEFLAGGTLDAAKAGHECLGCGEGGGGLGFGMVLGVDGGGGAGPGLLYGFRELVEVCRGNALFAEGGLVDAGGAENGVGFVDVLKLAAVEVAAGAGGFRDWVWLWCWFFWHGFCAFL